ncbi:MAG TPA: hypothetical protein VD908_04240 [Cytophagales bacterium]|nr:hypothetical protein [Cytophagales bacterium]
MARVRYFLIVFICVVAFSGCKEKKELHPEPHLEMGQEISFPGCAPNKSYIIIGYKKNYEGPVEKDWNNQDYVVFIYINELNDVKEATIHKNSLLKK